MKFNVKSLLKDKTVLYVVLFFAVTNFFGYMLLRNYNAVIMMILIGLITSYFSKNMIVILLCSIVGASIMTGANTVNEMFLNREGFDDKEGSSKDSDSEKTLKKKSHHDKDQDKHHDKDHDKHHHKDHDEDDNKHHHRHHHRHHHKHHNDDDDDDSSVKPHNHSNKKYKKVKSGFTTRGPEIQYAPASEEVEDEEVGQEDVDPTEMALNNLDNLLGGESGASIIKNQEDLKESMKNLEPLMNQAGNLLEGLNKSNLIGKLEGLVNRIGKK